jgi:co-chaperonin GroES (HSP10)
MNIKPLKKKVLVAENKTETKSAAGIILDGVGSVDTKTGTVVAIGPEVTQVKVGDVIYLDWAKCQVVKQDDIYRAMVDEEFIIGVIEE